MKEKYKLKGAWSEEPKIVVLSYGVCDDLAIIPKSIMDNIDELKSQFCDSQNTEYDYPECGSGCLNYHFKGEQFINYINENYLRDCETKAILIKYTDKQINGSLKRSSFKFIYL